MNEPLFEVIDELPREEPRTKGGKKQPKYDLDNRTVVGWYKLPHSQGFCTCPLHDQYQELITGVEQKEYRQRYPVRMLHPIGDYMVCRDCFLVSADVEAVAQNLDPLVFDA